ncbi:terpenoid cyclases/protein prenyltransferase alpha-alpha toroid [Parachaetomium inaequale]|uniref:Terpenoid cyclases/protein prenyltransferase alpha-alpha toroid n=1 Tax=Parachaetomium inaequale TaxID=2588326 RepID=A0AAN6PD26_9PEZI|nr:terpenoid cyclases/protein prenyltransferase alpha-alpha toroid [Parachaetomium inaequale]
MTPTPDPPEPDSEPVLDIDRHLKYWKMCLQAPLPNHYLSNEGVRMTLAYFIVNSIRILTPSPSPADGSAAASDSDRKPPLIPPEDHRKLRQWVLSHQQPGGGFAPSSTLVFPVRADEAWEAETGADEGREGGAGLANLAATLFALQLLALLADEGEEGAAGAFEGVDRVQTLRWLRRLQREDGSFGEVLKRLPAHGWFIGGGYDMRYCYIAASIRWMLRGDVGEGEAGWVEDFDTEGLARYILGSQTYDGGFAGSSQEEPHAGYAYCAIAALSLLDRPLTNSTPFHPNTILHSGIRDMPGLLHWLASRQFVYLEPPPPTDSDSEEDEDNFLLPQHLSDLALSPTGPRHVACNGRCNKVADTCYTWWVGAAQANLGHGDLLDWRPSRRFLLDKMAHRIGGFSKHPGGPPDVYHGCFGLAALAVMGEPGLAEFDSALAVPVATVRVIERARAALVERAGVKGAGLGKGAVEMGLAMRGGRPAWLSG